MRFKSEVPKKDFETKCRIRWVGPGRSSYITAVLKNPDKRLNFSETELQLPPDGGWVDFSIYGEKKSEKVGDAKLKVHENSGSGPLLSQADVTVYFFEPADITIGRGGSYKLIGRDFRPKDGFSAVNFRYLAHLKPDDTDCTAKPIANILIGLVQNVLSFETIETYVNPEVIAWDSSVPSGGTALISKSHSLVVKTTEVLNDSHEKKAPLYDQPGKGKEITFDENSTKPPMGCEGGKEASSEDSPKTSMIYPRGRGPNGRGTDSQGRQVVLCEYKTLKRITLKFTFRVWCVTFDETKDPTEVVPLRESTWSIDIASDASGQYATTPANDQDPSHDPILDGRFFNDIVNDIEATGTPSTEMIILTRP